MDRSSASTLPSYAPKVFFPRFKRLFDIVFSLSFILILSPIYLLIALLIKLSSKGPIFYVTKRLGKNKKHITVYKFRTMYLDADARLKDLLKKNPKMREEWEVYQKLKSDPRCTPVGKFLRRTSLDEFPQFFNVLKGDLSVVGPRPHFIFELEENKASPLHRYADKILSVKPGITGLWQTSGRSCLAYDDRVELDCLYVDKQAFLFDLYLILKTIPSVLFSKGAF